MDDSGERVLYRVLGVKYVIGKFFLIVLKLKEMIDIDVT